MQTVKGNLFLIHGKVRADPTPMEELPPKRTQMIDSLQNYSLPNESTPSLLLIVFQTEYST